MRYYFRECQFFSRQITRRVEDPQSPAVKLSCKSHAKTIIQPLRRLACKDAPVFLPATYEKGTGMLGTVSLRRLRFCRQPEQTMQTNDTTFYRLRFCRRRSCR